MLVVLIILNQYLSLEIDFFTIVVFYLYFQKTANNKILLANTLIICELLKIFHIIIASWISMLFFGKSEIISIVELVSTMFVENLLLLLLLISSKVFKVDVILRKYSSVSFLLLTLTLLSLVFAFLSLVHYYEAFNEMVSFTLVFLIIETLFVSFLIFKEKESYIKKAENNNFKKQLEVLQEYTNLLETEQLKLRKFKHDYQNLIVSFRANIESTDAHAMEMIDRFEMYSEKQLASVIWIFKDVRQIEVRNLKSLIISKMFKAQNEGIKVNFECREPIKKINMDEFDFLRVIGNLIDNAIEATMLCEKKEIGICLFIKDTQFTVVLTNTYREELKLTNITHSGYTTKENHLGLGLTNIEEIKKKNPNLFVQYQAINQVFTAKVSLELAS